MPVLLLELSQPRAPLLQSFVLLGIPIVVVVLLLVGRRPRMILRATDEGWKIIPNQRVPGWIVTGLIEPYNKSGRTNSIVQYELLVECNDQWISTDVEENIEASSDDFQRRHWPTPQGLSPTSATPLSLGPYSSVGVRITGITTATMRPKALRLTVTDSFGKKYSVEVPADEVPAG